MSSGCLKRRVALLRAMKDNFKMLFSDQFLVFLSRQGIIEAITTWVVVAVTFIVSSLSDIYCMIRYKDFPAPTRMSIVDGEVVYYPDDE